LRWGKTSNPGVRWAISREMVLLVVYSLRRRVDSGGDGVVGRTEEETTLREAEVIIATYEAKAITITRSGHEVGEG
jgi:hypothetical protein